MSFASLVLRRATYKLIKSQIYIAITVSILALILFNISMFFSCLYGAFIAISATLISSWRINRAGNLRSNEAQQGYVEVYLGAIQKYILTLFLFAVGMGGLHLAPVPMIVSFALLQLAYLFIDINTSVNIKK
ncbi:MAG: ATP synthase subunit I [Pseudomonadota bacterium]